MTFKDGKSSFRFLLMMTNPPICAGAHYGLELTSAASKRFSKIVFFSYAMEVVDTINGQLDWAINSIILDIKL